MSSSEKLTKPLPIPSRNRPRSFSVSSASSDSASSSSDPTTPPLSPQRGSINIPLPSSSPIISYVLAQSPKTSTAATFPFQRKFGTAPAFEVDEVPEKEIPVATHARRASATVANRFSQTPTTYSDARSERGANVLRRLSLSSTTFTKGSSSTPNPPPNTAVTPTPQTAPFTNKPHRSATISMEKPRRAPSPMGERILKGHFDGFN